MSDENRVNEAEANTEEQPVAETPTGEDAPVLEEGAEQAVADTDRDSEDAAVAEPEVEVVAETEVEAVAEPEAEAVEEPVAVAAAEPADTDSSQEDQEGPTFNRVEGPAIYNRARQGNQRRNPRHVGNDVRIDEIDYKNIQVLSRFVDNYGRIHNRRKTRVTAKLQRKVTRAIKRARHLALMPYTGEHIRITGRRG